MHAFVCLFYRLALHITYSYLLITLTYLFLIGLCGSGARFTHLLFVILRSISTAFLKAEFSVNEK